MVNPGPYGGPPADEPAPYGNPASPPPPPYGAPPPPYGAPPPYNTPMGGGPGMPMNGVGQPGTLGDRFVARFIDGLIVGVVSLVINFMLAFVSNSWILTGLISAVITTALYIGYFGYLESSRGQTIGKQAMRLKVLGPDRVSNPTLEQAVRRNLFMAFGILRVIPFFGGLLSGLAVLASVIVIAVNISNDPQRQHWFDKFAGGTQVIKIG